MKSATRELFLAKEFAALAGVTVRALHHYDRLGLLRPKQRSAAGYRLYSMRDFARLEQIVVLKFLGIPLKQIRALLESESNLLGALQQQQDVLYKKRVHLDRAIRAIANAQDSLRSRREPDWKLFQLIVREIEMQNKWNGKRSISARRHRPKSRPEEVSYPPKLRKKPTGNGPSSTTTSAPRLAKILPARKRKPWPRAGAC